MTSTLGGDDEAHDYSPEEKDKKEFELRKEAESLKSKGKHKERRKKLDQANEISRRKSKKAHQ